MPTPYTPHAAGTPGLVAAEAAQTGASGFPDLPAALQIVDRAIEPSINAAVKAGFLRFALVDGTISVWDAERQQKRRFASTDVNVSVDPASGNLTLSFASSGYGGRWTATLARQVDPETGGRALSAEFGQLTIADIFPDLNAQTSQVTADIPLFGHATAHFARDGKVVEASVKLDVGAGTITFGDTRETMLLDEASLLLRWDIPNNTIVIDPSPISFGDTHGSRHRLDQAAGQAGIAAIRLRHRIEGSRARLARLNARAARCRPDRLHRQCGFPEQPDYDRERRDRDAGCVDRGHGQHRHRRTFAALLGGGDFLADGSRPAEADVAAIHRVRGDGAGFSSTSIAAGIAAGQFDARLPVSFLFARKKPPIAEDAMRLDLRLEDVEFTTYGELPPVKHAYGNAVLAGSTFGVDVEKGEVETASGGTVSVDNGSFAIANALQRGGEGVIDVQLSGDAAGLGEIANSKPFLALERRQLDPPDLSGKAQAAISVRLPLKPGITESEVDWKVVVTATGVSSKAPVEGRVFSDANVTITVSPDAASIKGKAKIDGVVADVSISQPLGQGGAAAGPGERTARLTLDDAARKRLGIGLDEILGGAIGAQISNIEDGSKGQHYDLDLRRARVNMPGLGWSKAIGVPATLTFDVKSAESGYSVENIEFGGAGFGFTGSARLNQSYGLISADVEHFALHQGDALSFQLTRTKNGYAIVAKGASFDLKGVLDQIENGGDHEMTAPDVTIDARVDKLVGFNQQAVAGARLALASSEGSLQKLNISGAIGGSDLSVAYDDSSAGASLLVSSENAGNVFSFINIYTRLDGGRLSITGQRDGPEGPLVGTFELSDFNLMNEPAVSKLAASRGGHAGGEPVARPFRPHGRPVPQGRSPDQRRRGPSARFEQRRHVQRTLRPRRVAHGDQRHVHPGLRFQQCPRPHPPGRADSDRRHFGRPFRRDLPHRGPAERPAHHVQPAIGRDAGDLQEDLRVPLSGCRVGKGEGRAHAVRDAWARPGGLCPPYSGFTSTCFLRPSESLIAPATRFAVDRFAVSSASA